MPTRMHVLCAAILLAFAIPTPARAEDGIWKVGHSYVIRFEKLDLSQPTDRQILLSQVERAAGKLCDGQRTKARRAACANETIASIRDSVEPTLRASLDVARFERDGIQQAAR